jgi:tetratricopeptide (TPR) repeat protein
MKAVWSLALIALACLIIVGRPGQALAQEAAADPMRAAFQRVIDDFNNNNLDTLVAAVDQEAMLDSIFEDRLISQNVRSQFRGSFAGRLEQMFVSAFPATDEEILGRIVGFNRNGDRATCVVRYDLPRYQFMYHEFQLRSGRGQAVVIEDWIDFNSGEQFTDSVGDSLVMALPGQSETRALLSPVQLDDAQVFQVSELLKSARDKKAKRYFEILDGLGDPVKSHHVIALTSVHVAQQGRDGLKYRAALETLAKNYANEPLFASMLLDYYLPNGDFESAMQAMLRLGSRLGEPDAALKARMATLALILGNTEQAHTHAEAAVEAEPELELTWWAVLRTRTAQEKYAEAVQALTVLERQFGHKLRTTALENDSILATLLETDEFKAWSAP